MTISPGSCRGRVLWRSHMPHPMLAMPSHAISCTPTPSWSSSKCRNTPSTNQLHVFSFQVGRSVLLNKDYCLNTSSSSSKTFRQGGNAWNLLDFDSQSAAIICVDTIKYYSIPSVQSRLEGFKTRSQIHSLLSIIVDGRSRGIVRTDLIPKPGMSSTLPSTKRKMLQTSSRTGGPPHNYTKIYHSLLIRNKTNRKKYAYCTRWVE